MCILNQFPRWSLKINKSKTEHVIIPIFFISINGTIKQLKQKPKIYPWLSLPHHPYVIYQKNHIISTMDLAHVQFSQILLPPSSKSPKYFITDTNCPPRFLHSPHRCWSDTKKQISKHTKSIIPQLICSFWLILISLMQTTLSLGVGTFLTLIYRFLYQTQNTQSH